MMMLMLGVESADVYQVAPKFVHPFSELLYPVDGDIPILEETATIKIEMFHHRIKIISSLSQYCSTAREHKTNFL